MLPAHCVGHWRLSITGYLLWLKLIATKVIGAKGRALTWRNRFHRGLSTAEIPQLPGSVSFTPATRQSADRRRSRPGLRRLRSRRDRGGVAVRPLSVCAEAKQVSTALSRAAQQPLSMCGTLVRMSAPDRPDDPLAWPVRSLKGRIERSAAVIRMAALAQLRCCGRASQQRGPEKRGRRYQIPSLRDHRAGPA
jgi:hypothetical protein